MITESLKPGSLKKGKSKLGTGLIMTSELGVFMLILILSIVTSLINKNFLTWRYISSILTGSIFIGAAALGEALVIMSGEIDLSVGMNGCLAGIMFGTACSEWGFGLVPCILVCLFSGAIIGAVNSFLVCNIGLSAWITTLTTQFICQGLAVTISQGEPISISSLGTSSFTRAKPLGLTWLFFVFLGLIVILDIVVGKTPLGYRLRSVGGNKEASLMAGINAKRIKWVAFVLAGMLAATGGLFDVLQNAAASSASGAGREFRAIICCAIGGISLSGGSGSIFGAGLGVLLFHTLWYCLRILGIDTNLQLVLIGFILIIAVLLDIQRKRLEISKNSLEGSHD
jgi:ribose transport system permease protein